MKKITKIIAALAILTILPMSALAHNNDNDDDNKIGLKLQSQVLKRRNLTISGTITAVSSTGFTLQSTATITPFTVLTADAKIIQAFGMKIHLADIHVNDKAKVKGTVEGSVIMAKKVVVTPPNTHPAKGKGMVTAVGGNSFTLQTNHQGIISNVTVNTNASTTIITKNGSATTSAAIVVGSKVKIKGLWNEILNVLNAIKVKIIR